jgi:hypothetical protein
MIGDLRLFPPNMQPHSFSKRQLAAIALMLDGEKDFALSDKKSARGFTSSKIRTTWSQIANDFWDLCNFPNCTGAIDTKHVRIQAPPNIGSKFFNYKQFFFVVLLALVDARYKSTVVDKGSHGGNSDGGIFVHLKLGKYLETHLGIPEDKWLPGILF